MKNQTETIRKMVTYLNNEEKEGGFWLPDIQRPFVWSEYQIIRLFDSIMRQYPISTLLVWKTKSDIRMRSFIEDYKTNIRLSEFCVEKHNKPKVLVLDGQQRLQSLLIGLKGSFDGKELYFDSLSGEKKAPEDMRYNFRFMSDPKEGSSWVKVKDIVFNTTISTLKRNILKNMGGLKESQEASFEENIEQIRNAFCNNAIVTYQEIDSIDQPDDYEETDVVEIFIRANSGGTQLGKSDLLFSLLTSSWDGAGKEIEELLEIINTGGYRFTQDFILKTCLTLLNKGAAYDVKKFRNSNVRNAIIDSWEQISEAVNDVRNYLHDNTFLRQDAAMPSYFALIPLIYFRYHFKQQWHIKNDITEYILRVLMSGALSGGPDGMIDQLVSHIKYTKTFNAKNIFNLISTKGRSVNISKQRLLGACLNYTSNSKTKHKLIYALLNLWYRDLNLQPDIDQNHLPKICLIFPEDQLLKVKELSEKTGRNNVLRYKAEQRTQLANCILLDASEHIGEDKNQVTPDIWFANKSDAYLDMHLIPKDRSLWQIEHYDLFIESRQKLIIKKFEPILQKEI